MSTLVFGAAGLLGTTLLNEFSAIGADRDDIDGMRSIDACDRISVARLIDEIQPSAVLFPAAQPHVDICERDPDVTAAINIVAPAATAELCASRGISFVFYSSDYVFGGEKGKYTETDEPRPLCVYGRQKLEAEKRIFQAHPSALILRTSGMYGNERTPRTMCYGL